MRHPMRAIAATSTALCLSGCLVGPHQLRRSVDDWDHDTYVESPWKSAAMWIVPVFPVCYVVAGVGDLLVTDPYAFWCHDAWDGKGTGFKHYTPESNDGRMYSMLIDDAHWLEIR